MPRQCSSPTNVCGQCQDMYQQILFHKKNLGPDFPPQLTQDVIFPRMEVFPFVLTHVIPDEVAAIDEEFTKKVSKSIGAWFKREYGVNKVPIHFNATPIQNRYGDPGTHLSMMVDAPESMIPTDRDVEDMLRGLGNYLNQGWKHTSFEDLSGHIQFLRLEFFENMLYEEEGESDEKEEDIEQRPVLRRRPRR